MKENVSFQHVWWWVSARTGAVKEVPRAHGGGSAPSGVGGGAGAEWQVNRQGMGWGQCGFR